MAEGSAAQPDAAGAALYCPQCMYDLRGLSGVSCPECGETLDRGLLGTSSIPWVHRKGLGVRAFLKTAWRATFKTNYFCVEVARPVSLTDARKFRRRVVGALTVVGMLFGLLVALMIDASADLINQVWLHHPWLGVLCLAVAAGPLWLYLMGLTGLHMYWFHPKALPFEQQNRAVAISHYACAPLLGLIPAVIGIGLALITASIGDVRGSAFWEWVSVIFGIPGGLVVVLSLTAYLFVSARMAQHAAHRSGVTRALLWFVQPALWLAWAGLVFVVLPAAGFYIYLMVSSM